MYFPALGGAELYVKELSEGLKARGHEVTLLTANVRNSWDLWPGICGDFPDAEVINGVKVIRFRPDGGFMGSLIERWQSIRGGYRSSALMFGEDGAKFLTHKPLLIQLIPYLARTRADIVASVNWYWPPAYHTYLASRLKRFTHVGIPLFHTAETWCSREIYQKMLSRCEAVVVNTAYEASFITQRASTRVVVAGVGIHPRLFACRNGVEIRKRYRLQNFPIVGFVGRQAANKGATTLIHAMQAVWKWNSEVRLILAGPRSHRHGEVETLLESLTDIERQRIITIRDFPEEEKASIYDSFDVFVLPSIAESFGISYLEAWLCNKPVIGARIGPTQCVIDEGINGLLVDPNDPQDIGRAIIELLSDKDKRERMGRNGHAKAIGRFTWDKVIDKVENLYLELFEAQQ